MAGVQDYIPELVGMSKANLDKDDETMLTSGRVQLKVRSELMLRGWMDIQAGNVTEWMVSAKPANFSTGACRRDY